MSESERECAAASAKIAKRMTKTDLTNKPQENIWKQIIAMLASSSGSEKYRQPLVTTRYLSSLA